MSSSELVEMKITPNAMRNMARRAGVKRIAKNVYRPTRALTQRTLSKLVKGSLLSMSRHKRSTITESDVRTFLMISQGLSVAGRPHVQKGKRHRKRKADPEAEGEAAAEPLVEENGLEIEAGK
jgi:histone H3/H4